METAESPKPVHVVSLTVANVKRIKAARVEPDASANLVLIGGANDQGKSSLLDAMISVLGGKEASPEKPVRKGAKKGSVVLDLGDLVCTRRFTAAGGSELIVEDKEGKRLPSPQAIMDKLTGKVGFDAEDFIRRNPNDQLTILRRIVGVDFGAIEQRKKGHYEQRTIANGDVKRLEAQLAGSPNPECHITSPVDTAQVMADMNKAIEHNKGREPLAEAFRVALSNAKSYESDVQDCRADVEKHTKAIADAENALRIAKQGLVLLKEELERAEKSVNSGADAITKASSDLQAFEVKDLEDFQTKLRWADANNTTFRQAEARKKLVVELRAAEARAQGLTNKVDECDTEKQTLLENAKFPVKGLSFTEDGILFDGFPFSQASSSVKRRVSVAIGAALNPTLRVMIVKDGSLLDAKSMEQLRELAKEHNLQVWVEVVTTGPDSRCAVIIDDGEVVGAPKVEDEPEVAAPAVGTTVKDPEPPADLFGDLPAQ